MSEWFNDAFSKFGKVSGVTWIALGVVAALGLIVLAVSMSKKKWTVKMIAFGALAIALSFVLSCVRLYRMPTGGSVTPGSMLPLMLFSVSFGIGPGLVAGLAYEVLKAAAASDSKLARAVRAPGLALQRITTAEPTADMVEVALAAFNLAMDPPDHEIKAVTEHEAPAAPAPEETDDQA